MKLNEVFPSSYIAAADLDGNEKTVTIESVEQTQFQNDPRPKLVIKMRGTDRGFVVNKTNATTIASFYGDETDNWLGKRITLIPAQTANPAGQQVPCIRVKLMQPPAAEPQPMPGNPQRPPADGYGNDSPF